MIVYDLETYPNCFLCCASSLDKDDAHVWEISDRRNDLESLLEWLRYLAIHQIHMIGYNNLGFDYPIIHRILQNPSLASPDRIARHATEIIEGDRFASMIWADNRIIPQIDLMKIYHFDNHAKSQSLKGLEYNMRSESVQDLPIAPGTILTSAQIDELIEYNKHDVSETRRFAHIAMPAIEFRQKMAKTLIGDVLNFNDVKLGEQVLIQRLPEHVCYDRSSGRREPRQTHRDTIPLKDVILPYIRFSHPELQRVHQYLLDTVLVGTKGTVAVDATIAGFTFHFGSGGIHGSVDRQIYRSDDSHTILDCDVASLYPSIAIVNRLHPEHLGDVFVTEYSALKDERFKHKKGTPENGALKLALNGTYGKSNDPYSPFYDPKFTMAITINGQLLVAMLAEQLLASVPGIEMIQVNTDGITVRMPRSSREQYDSICKAWEKYTCLDLEYAEYKSMWIRDVNNYIADKKLKGAFWYPDPSDWNNSISSAGAWHKDLSSPIVQMAAHYHMAYGVDIADFMRVTRDPYLFCLRAKAARGFKIFIGEQQQQRVTRYYVTNDGEQIYKYAPPVEGAVRGAFKKRNGVDWSEYDKYPKDVWNPTVHTGNGSRYEDRRMSINSGYLVRECNRIDKFDWSNVNYDWYVNEANKLVVT